MLFRSRGVCYAYVEVFRNIPVLLQLLMWYLLFTDILPPIAEAMSVGNMFFLSKAGLSFPVPASHPGVGMAMGGAILGIVVAIFYRRWAFRQFELTGNVRSMFLVPLGMVVAGWILGWAVGGAPTTWTVPKPEGFSMEGGASATPEFMGVLLGLVFYTAGFIAEVVRAGIASVARGQSEAAGSLGVSKNLTMRDRKSVV